MVKFTKVFSDIEKKIDAMVARSNRIQGYLNRVVYRQYQNAQRKRWMTENVSEGERWLPLNPAYAARKREVFASYRGAGRKMLIATGRLSQAVIGGSDEHKKTVTNRQMTIAWSTPYAVYVEEVRPFAEFSDKTMEGINNGLAEFLVRGMWRDVK